MWLGYGLDNEGIPAGVTKFISFSKRPERLWGPHGFLCNGYRRSSALIVKMTTRLHHPRVLEGVELSPLKHSSSDYGSFRHTDHSTFFLLSDNIIEI